MKVSTLPWAPTRSPSELKQRCRPRQQWNTPHLGAWSGQGWRRMWHTKHGDLVVSLLNLLIHDLVIYHGSNNQNQLLSIRRSMVSVESVASDSWWDLLISVDSCWVCWCLLISLESVGPVFWERQNLPCKHLKGIPFKFWTFFLGVHQS